MENTYQPADVVAVREGLKSSNELIGKYFTQNEVPATCSQGCMVKANEYCEHNQPSVLKELGLA